MTRMILCLVGAMVLAAGPMGPWQSPAAHARGGKLETTRYVVKRGDTLSEIADRFGCSVRDLRALNGRLSGDTIRIGQRLIVPITTKSDAPATKPDARAKTGASKANSSNTGSSNTRRNAPDAKAPRGELMTHRVAPGDTVSEIAKRYGTTVDQIRRDNRLRRDIIRIGQKLRVRAVIPHRKKRRFVYTIEPGDTLSAIGEKFDVSWPQVARWNPRKDPKRLRVGSRLTIYVEGPKVRSATAGRPQHGKLVNGEQLPPGPGYRRQNPHKTWGTNETITQILRVIADLRTKHPRAHAVLIGDISKKGGGKLAPHISHQSGRDVDIGFVFKHLPPEGTNRFLRLRRNLKNIDFRASWTLIKAITGRSERTSKVQHVFLSYPEQKIMYEWAKKNGATKRELEFIFQYPRGKRALAGKIRHVKGHTGHMHIRFKCPPEDVSCVM